MAKCLVIVESPAKAKTVNRYLGPEYIVKASMGHICDLPKSKLGVDIEHDFTPEYKIIPERKKLISELEKAAGEADAVYLAADPDREGEAICWHLSSILSRHNSRIFRVLFYEITKNAVSSAFTNTMSLDENKFNAQQARRILDRLVGYLISPLLWKKIGRGLSAGRVQSIALRLICEREEEIKKFRSEEYWTISARMEASRPPQFKAVLDKIDSKKAKIGDGDQAAAILSDLEHLPFILKNIKVAEKKKNPPPPYITSTLQQEAYRFRRFSVKKTMMVAQRLYEGMEIGEKGLTGLITYMRTDSVRISDEALNAARDFICSNYSEKHLPKKPRTFKNRKKAQDAHEAIRPTSVDLTPEKVQAYLNKDELALYTMIWKRFIASQMASALIEETEFQIEAGKYGFKSKGTVIRFEGFLVLNAQKDSDEENEKLPSVTAGETLTLLDLESKQNFTQPPPRYTEGSLVKELEARGIGRPSTYAPIISTIQGRVYVVKEEGKFVPTDLGIFVNGFLVENFPDLLEFKFTASLEEELDLISEGGQNWLNSIKSYYDLLNTDLEKAQGIESIKPKGIPASENCPQCGLPLVIKESRYGRFKACSGYPDCKYKQSLVKKEAKPLEENCPQCGSRLVERRGKYGSFTACSNYPNCSYIKKEVQDTGISCPQDCGGTLIRRKTRRGKIFFGCSRFPKCKYATWDEPLPQPCPKCGRPFILRKNKIRSDPVLHCSDENCPYEETVPREKLWEK